MSTSPIIVQVSTNIADSKAMFAEFYPDGEFSCRSFDLKFGQKSSSQQIHDELDTIAFCMAARIAEIGVFNVDFTLGDDYAISGVIARYIAEKIG